jgi:hypothetical protein
MNIIINSKMKLIIAGSRDILMTVNELNNIIGEHFDITQITEIVSGCAQGIDLLGIKWATKNEIPVKKFIPDWSLNGKAAGHIRNREMGNYTDQAIVIYNGSKGSQGMIDYMKKINKPCVVVVKLL